MNRIIELLSIKNDDNRIEIDAEIYTILISENIIQEETMDTIKEYAIGLWSLAIAHKKVSAAVIAIIVLLIILN